MKKILCILCLFSTFFSLVFGYDQTSVLSYVYTTPDLGNITFSKVFDDFGPICYTNDQVSIRILMYHYVRETSRDPVGSVVAGNSIDADTLQSHFHYLKNKVDQEETTVMFFSELEEAISKNCFTNKSVIVLSADDGWRDNYGQMFPLMKEYGIKVNLGIIYNRVSQTQERIDPFMTANEIREMISSGLAEVQSHTISHSDLSKLSYWSQKVELCASKFYLESLFDITINTIIYPMGKANAHTHQLAKSCGYTFGLSTKWGHTSPAEIATKKYDIQRIRVTKDSVLSDLFGE